MAARDRVAFRKEALIWSARPEALDDLLRITAPHERIFRAVLLILLSGLVVWIAFAA